MEATASERELNDVDRCGALEWHVRARISSRRVARALKFAARSGARHVFAALFAGPLLRLAIGRRPLRAETSQFARGFRDDTMLPPLLRALTAVPAAREPLTRAMLASWMLADEQYRGRLRLGFDSNIGVPGGDVLRVWTGPPLAFLHIPKTGGSSVMDMLRSLFHPAQIAPEHEVRHIMARRQNAPDESVPGFWKYGLIGGHFDYPDFRRIDRHRTLITFFRDPAKRILSLYYYWRSFDQAWLSASEVSIEIQRAWSLPLLSFLRCDDLAVLTTIDNGYVRRLTGFGRWPGGPDHVAADEAGALRLALAALDDIACVGITERMSESVAVLARHLDVVLPAAPPRVNVTEANESGPWARFRPVVREPVTEAIGRELARLTRLDRIVYEAALARLDAAMSTLRGSG